VRFCRRSSKIPQLRLLHQLDDENVPVERNIFDSTPAHDLIEELCHKANSIVAKKLFSALPEKAFLRRQASPNPRRLRTFVERMNRLGYEIDPTSSGTLQNSLSRVEDSDIRKVCFGENNSASNLLMFVRGWKPSLLRPCSVQNTT
jgi:protein SSD1